MNWLPLAIGSTIVAVLLTLHELYSFYYEIFPKTWTDGYSFERQYKKALDNLMFITFVIAIPCFFWANS